ncbi:MAG: hypothetical protein KDD94_04085 [Calditrichaeota bacterium]|nr:hypothetical protein [Calditrichota bacterium]
MGNLQEGRCDINVLLADLEGGDIRSIGESERVVQKVIDEPGFFPLLVEGFFVDDPIIRSRATDAAVKILKIHRQLLLPFQSRVLYDLPIIDQKETKWHYCMMLDFLEFNEPELKRVFKQLTEFLREDDKFLKVFVMQALVDIVLKYSIYQAETIDIVNQLTVHGTASQQARGRKLLKTLRKAGLIE